MDSSRQWWTINNSGQWQTLDNGGQWTMVEKGQLWASRGVQNKNTKNQPTSWPPTPCIRIGTLILFFSP